MIPDSCPLRQLPETAFTVEDNLCRDCGQSLSTCNCKGVR